MDKRLIAKGIFCWTSTERRTQRYGSIHVSDSPYEESARAEVYYDEVTLTEWRGQRVRLTARVVESRPSTHAGDRAIDVKPVQPTVGEVVDLGVGVLSTDVSLDGLPDILLVPVDGRERFWIDPRQLYRLHDQTVEIYAEQTTDAPSPAPDFRPTLGKRAWNNGDGSFQVVNVPDGESVRLLPRIVPLGSGAAQIDCDYAPGEEIKLG